MPWYSLTSSSHTNRQRPTDSIGQNRQGQQSGDHAQIYQVPVTSPPSYQESSGRHHQQQPYAQNDDVSQPHPRAGGQNRHDQQSLNLNQSQAPVGTLHPYNGGSGRHYREQRQDYSQRNHILPTQACQPQVTHSSRSRRSQPRAPLFRAVQPQGPPNIVIFGETGTGKSSLINMLSDEGTAPVSNRAVGCTFESAPYTVTINGRPYTLWDTAGLNEGDAGSIPGDQALSHLRDLVDNLKDGLSLLVYCIRGTRFRDIIKVNYDLFTEIICQCEVPVVVVVTGLENEDRMEDWWTENEHDFTERKMKFHGHACITTSKGKKNMFQDEYEESLATVRALIQKCCPQNAWVVDSDQWLNRISSRIQDYYDDYNGYSRHATGPYREGGDMASRSLFALAKGLITFLLMDRGRT